jgi:hypothetical protein
VKTERDAAEARVAELTAPPPQEKSAEEEQGSNGAKARSPVLQVPMGSVSDFELGDLSQNLKAAREEVRICGRPEV